MTHEAGATARQRIGPWRLLHLIQREATRRLIAARR
jgi:hypothetical protein